MGTTLVAINAALRDANLDVSLVKIYAAKHEFVGPDAPKLNPVVAYTNLGAMTPDQWVELYRERAAEKVPDISESLERVGCSRRNDLDLTGVFVDWNSEVRTNGKHKRAFREGIASLCGVTAQQLLLIRHSLHKPGWDKAGANDTHLGEMHWFLSFEYHPEIVSILREVPFRSYSKYTKEWVVPVTQTETLLEKIVRYFGAIVATDAEEAYANLNRIDIRRSVFGLLPSPYSFPVASLLDVFEHDKPAIFTGDKFVPIDDLQLPPVVSTKYPFLLLRDARKYMSYSPISGEIEAVCYDKVFSDDGRGAARLIAMFRASCAEWGGDVLGVDGKTGTNDVVFAQISALVFRISNIAVTVNSVLPGFNLRIIPSEFATTSPKSNALRDNEYVAYVSADSRHLDRLAKRVYRDPIDAIVRPVVVSSRYQSKHSTEEWLDTLIHEGAHWIAEDLTHSRHDNTAIPMCIDESHGILFHMIYAALRSMLDIRDQKAVMDSLRWYRDRENNPLAPDDYINCCVVIEDLLPAAVCEWRESNPASGYVDFVTFLDAYFARNIGDWFDMDDEA